MLSDLSRRDLIFLATGGSVLMLASAYAFEAAGFVPCVLCWYQRYPHMAAVLIGALALTFRLGWLAWLGALAAAATMAIGVFHAGVEYQFWPGLQTCAVDVLTGVAAEDLLSTDITVAAPVACDRAPWSLFGISMAGLNALGSAGLAMVWVLAARKRV